MEVIDKADILADVGENLNADITSFTGTSLDRQIIKTLTDMSNKGLLVGTDDTQTLADGDTTLDYPTGFRSAINITLTDTSDNTNYPLIKLPGGHKEYRERIAFGGGLVNPEWFSEFDGKFYLLGQASKSYTTLIEFRKNHPKTPDNIEFTTDFENLMFAGVTFWKAVARGATAKIAVWSPVYANEMRKAILNRKQQPSMMMG